MAKKSSKLFLYLLLAVVIANAVVTGVYGDRGGSGDRGKGSGETFPPDEGRGDAGGAGGRGSGVFPPDEGSRGSGGSGSGGYGPSGGRGGYGPAGGSGSGGRRGWTELRRFILHDSTPVVTTDAGGMRVVRGVGGKMTESPMHIGFITMEPNSMFIPQYLDSSLIIFVETGEARIGSIYKDNLVEKNLTSGDLYRIQAGSAFYLVNTAQGQRLHIIASIDTAESSDWEAFQAFYLAGGRNPASVLAGFDTQTLSTAFNVSHDMIGELLSSRQPGAIVYINPDGQSQDQPSIWKKFLDQGTRERKTQMRRVVQVRRKIDDDEEKPTWSWKKILTSFFGNTENADDDTTLDSYNIFERSADFRNNYGWSIQVDGNAYEPLKKSDFGVYLVNLSAGSMMAPHVNPEATEYGVVLSGTGNIQVVFPNGTLAMDAEVNEGDVFWIPRYFPFCQVASRSNPFVFFGFSTASHNNRPQFLVGKGSLLETMITPEFAAAFGMDVERFRDIVDAQSENTILPSASASPGGGGEEIPEGEGDPSRGGGGSGSGSDDDESIVEKMGSKIRMKKSSFGYNMAMGMD